MLTFKYLGEKMLTFKYLGAQPVLRKAVSWLGSYMQSTLRHFMILVLTFFHFDYCICLIFNKISIGDKPQLLSIFVNLIANPKKRKLNPQLIRMYTADNQGVFNSYLQKKIPATSLRHFPVLCLFQHVFHLNIGIISLLHKYISRIRDAKSGQHGQHACAIFSPSCANFWPVNA